MAQRKFHCKGCGANVEFSPEEGRLTCPYCGTTRPLPRSEAEIRELDLGEALDRGFASAPTLKAQTVACGACGATTRLEGALTASRCSFCDAPLVAQPTDREVLLPQALLPFAVDQGAAKDAFVNWLNSRWFAPSDLRRRARRDGLDGIYLPFFTFDAATETFYRGERGEYYFVEERYTEEVDGKLVERTRQVRHTRWSPSSGTVAVLFDDVLVLASQGLPESLVRKLEPWDLHALVGFQESYLSGFLAECDQRGLKGSFEGCRERCRPVIDAEIRRDIGGDEQRIHRQQTAWSSVTFKHVLLPVWVSAFRYKDRVYRVVVNARTGEVQGERPWSWIKIGATVLAAAAIAATLFAIFGQQ